MGWVEQELAAAELGDVRLDLRLMQIVEALARHAEQSVPQMCSNWAEAKAAYRFWGNGRIDWQEVLRPHQQRTIQRAMAEPVVLVIQDNTGIDLTAHPATKGMGYLVSATTRGLIAHTSLAAAESGLPLGVIDLMLWTRPLSQVGKRYSSKRRKTADKESQRWIDGLHAAERALPDHPQVIVIGDREADFYDLFAAPRRTNVHLLVRICRESRSVEDPLKYLKPALQAALPAGELVVQVPRSRKHSQRTARLTVRFKSVAIWPPNQQRHHRGPRIPLSFVVVEESLPPAGEKPIRWVLATTVTVENLQQACRVVGWYARRWIIERFHYTLKSGYGLEQQQLENVEHVKRFMATLAIAAWRVLWLAYEAREHPQQDCTIVLDQAEWRALYAWTHRRSPRPLPKTPLTLGEAAQMIGQLGGHLSRKRDGPPGVKTLWRGLARLHDLTTGFLLATHPPDSSEDYG
jgi:hypothetical protein